jgi:hypothetical protein
VSTKSPFGAKQFKRTTEALYLDRLPGVAAFFFRGTNLFLPKIFARYGRRMNWRPEFCCREIGPGQIDDCPFLRYKAFIDSAWKAQGDIEEL